MTLKITLTFKWETDQLSKFFVLYILLALLKLLE